MFCRMKFTIRILSREKLRLKAALGTQTRVVWPWKAGERRGEEACTKIQGRKRGQEWELAVDTAKPVTLHVVGGGGPTWKMKSLARLRAELENGRWCGERECKVLEVSSPAQHPPGGHWYVTMGVGVLQLAVGVPQEPLVFLEDLFWGTDPIK